MAPYPSVARMSWGFRDTTDGECIGTGTQRNRPVIVDNDKTTNDNWSPVRQTRLAELTHACWLESATNLTNPGLAETCETYRRSNLRVNSASSRSSSPGCSEAQPDNRTTTRTTTNFFLELLPCTLEALTVIKTFCL